MKSEVKYFGYKVYKDGISCENSFEISVSTMNPLYKLFCGDTPFNWTTECENAFIKLK